MYRIVYSCLFIVMTHGHEPGFKVLSHHHHHCRGRGQPRLLFVTQTLRAKFRPASIVHCFSKDCLVPGVAQELASSRAACRQCGKHWNSSEGKPKKTLKKVSQQEAAPLSAEELVEDAPRERLVTTLKELKGKSAPRSRSRCVLWRDVWTKYANACGKWIRCRSEWQRSS